MSVKNFHVHADFNGSEIRNVSLEKLTTDPTGSNLFEGRVWINTNENVEKVYINGQVKVLAFLGDVQSTGNFVGTIDASGGLPTNGSGSDGSIRAGDMWVVTVAGTLVGIIGDDVLDVGDLLLATTDAPSNAGQWVGIQSNLNLGSALAVTEELTGLTFVAGTPLSIPTTLTQVFSIQFFDSDNEQIELFWDVVAQEATSNTALTGVFARIVGA